MQIKNVKGITEMIYSTGSMRVWVIVNVPSKPNYYPVKDWQHGARLISALADSQLLDSSIDSNAFGLEVLEDDNEWCEWEDELGGDIRDAMERVTKGKLKADKK